MSVIVETLTKRFGEQIAVDHISFQVESGTILGFLGPNGAGKTTTMKMLTSYLLPSSGTAKICGTDILKDPIGIRKHIGYLPEHNPLYLDMYVKEYLGFIAGLHKISRPKNRIAEIIEMTGLQIEQHKRISALSKGYRQRVGLAQAIMHDPEVLILDEPTSGLDPNQIKEIRALIRTLGDKKTLIFSSHILQEVQALCDRVLIINHGKLVADDSIDRLQHLIKKDTIVRMEFNGLIRPEDFAGIGGVKAINAISENHWEIICESDKDIRAALFAKAVEKNYVILTMAEQANTMEDIFQQLTTEQV